MSSLCAARKAGRCAPTSKTQATLRVAPASVPKAVRWPTRACSITIPDPLRILSRISSARTWVPVHQTSWHTSG
eukprot:6812827-Alexandrium_andersonii.AAC.1